MRLTLGNTFSRVMRCGLMVVAIALGNVMPTWALTPSQAVAIGDSSKDAEAARAAGCRVLTVPYGYNHGQPVQSIDSDGIVESLQDAAILIAH